MIRHIEFCLEEIECEIEAQSSTGISASGRLSLQRHIAEMRAVLAEWQTIAGSSDSITADEATASGDRLTLIRGIDTQTARLLAAKSVTCFQTIAEWRHHDIASLGHATLSLERIAAENWIEQAAILVTGQLTLHAKQIELARIATVEMVTAAIADNSPPEKHPADAIEATIALAQPIAAVALVQPMLEIAAAAVPTAPEANVVALAPAKTTSIARRLTQAAAAVAILAAGIGAITSWDLARVTAMTAALAEQSQIR